jgi:hypothetical protein
MKREADREQQSFGDVAFTDLNGTSIVFARGNLVMTARNIDGSRVVPPDLMRLLDIALITPPDTHEEIEDPKRFHFEEGEFSVGKEVQLLTDPNAPDFIPYTFCSAFGEVFLEGGKLFYRPEVAGLQTVEVFMIDPNSQATKQQLGILILE